MHCYRRWRGRERSWVDLARPCEPPALEARRDRPTRGIPPQRATRTSLPVRRDRHFILFGLPEWCSAPEGIWAYVVVLSAEHRWNVGRTSDGSRTTAKPTLIR